MRFKTFSTLLFVAGLIVPWHALASADGTARTRESHPCCETRYDFVRAPDGTKLRTIITRPREREGRLPAVLFVAWLSCDSIELQPGADDGWSRFQRALVRDTGAVVMRIDKPGVGESDGVCAETDFKTEVAGYKAALQALKRLDDVDPERIAIVGGSMGGVITPLVAEGERPRATAVWGAFAGTWLEHLLEQERRRLTLAGDPPGVVSGKLRGLGEIHASMLLDDTLPGELLATRPELRPLWYGESGGLFGRPAAFHRQLQEINIMEAWEKTAAPVLAVQGELDWFLSREEAERIADAVNRLRPGTARSVTIPRTDHHFMAFESPVQAFRGENGRYSAEATDAIVSFVRRHLEDPPDAGRTAQVPQRSDAAAVPATNRDLFTWVEGNWDVDATYHLGEGKTMTASGTWSFARALEGRAIQDVWRVSTGEKNPLGYGTTVRFYDRSIDAWRVTWHGVLNGSVLQFIARRQGSEIVMEMQRADQPSRWIFSDIAPASFRWRAVTSADDGTTWITQQEMTVRRRKETR